MNDEARTLLEFILSNIDDMEVRTQVDTEMKKLVIEDIDRVIDILEYLRKKVKKI